MQLGAEAVFVGSGIFKSSDPAARAKAIVEATTHYDDPAIVAKVSRGLGEAMPGLEIGIARHPPRRAGLVALTAPTARRRTGDGAREARPRIGVLGLQGAAREHRDVLTGLDVDAVDVRRPDDLDGIDGIVIPGGESTTISMLLERAGLFDPLAGLLSEGLPALGTCAGMILLATEVVDGRSDQRCFGAVDLTVRRNAFGRQVDSFETDLDVDGLGEPFPRRVHPGPVGGAGRPRRGGARHRAAVRLRGAPPGALPAGGVMVSSFHPELTADARIHRCFLARLGAEMSGHSKWATIKHKKGAADKARGKLFAKLIRQVEVAAREGGGRRQQPTPTLRTMFQKARESSVPLDTIERAIKRGTGELEGVSYEQVTYEGYAPVGRRRLRRGAHRQPQPHRRRDPVDLHQGRRDRWPSRVRSPGSSSARGW